MELHNATNKKRTEDNEVYEKDLRQEKRQKRILCLKEQGQDNGRLQKETMSPDEKDRSEFLLQETKAFLEVFGKESDRTGSQKLVWAKLSNKCRENEPTYVDKNSCGTAYLEGMRSVLIMIKKILKRDPYAVRQKKAINIERKEDE